MAADKEIMRQIETLRLDRPGRVYRAQVDGPLVWAIDELAKTYREEAELWAKSGAKGWKSNEAEALTIADAVGTVAAQLDNAGGGAALSVSDDALEAELRESAKRIDAVHDLAGLDALIADSVAERKGMVRDEFLPEGHPARSDVEPERKTAFEWNEDPTIDPVVVSWSDFGSSAYAQGIDCGSSDWPKPITRADFERARDGGTVTTRPRQPYERDGRTHTDADTFPGQASAEEVTAYLKGEANDIPGTPPLTPNSIVSAPELDDPFASRENDAQPDVLPKTWESDTMTADGHLLPGVAKMTAPLLGQPGDASAGYSHTYTPPGGRTLTFAELLQPVHPTTLPPHLSHSQIDDVGDCATQYRLQRVEQVPQVPQWADIGGSAFHAAVEDMERAVARFGGDASVLDGAPPETLWEQHFEDEIARVSASSTVPISMWRAARKGSEGRAWWEVNGPLMLRRYLAARPSEPTSSLPANPDAINGAVDPFQLAIELDLTVDVPTGYGPVSFNAKIDRVTNGPIPPDSSWVTLVVRDYKTSYERPTDTAQLGDYANVLRLWGVPESVKILGTYFDARRGEWTEPVDLLAEHPFEAFQYRVTAAHAQKRALTTGPTPARPSSYCGGCSVRYACPIMNQLKAVGR